MGVVVNVVDEDAGVAEVLTALLESYGYKSRGYLSVDSLLEALPHQEKSISLVSLGLPKRGASRLLAEIQNRHFNTLAVMMSGGVETSNIVEAIKAGAEDVIEKPLSINELLGVVERSVSKVREIGLVHSTMPDLLLETLTPEELSIFELLEQGATIKSIAAKLDISIRTVHYRKKSLLVKTGCKTCTEAVAKLSTMRSRMKPVAV